LSLKKLKSWQVFVQFPDEVCVVFLLAFKLYVVCVVSYGQ
jgi:hypothetical protein